MLIMFELEVQRTHALKYQSRASSIARARTHTRTHARTCTNARTHTHERTNTYEHVCSLARTTHTLARSLT
jgi:hypothetical protein